MGLRDGTQFARSPPICRLEGKRTSKIPEKNIKINRESCRVGSLVATLPLCRGHFGFDLSTSGKACFALGAPRRRRSLARALLSAGTSSGAEMRSPHAAASSARRCSATLRAVRRSSATMPLGVTPCCAFVSVEISTLLNCRHRLPRDERAACRLLLSRRGSLT